MKRILQLLVDYDLVAGLLALTIGAGTQLVAWLHRAARHQKVVVRASHHLLFQCEKRVDADESHHIRVVRGSVPRRVQQDINVLSRRFGRRVASVKARVSIICRYGKHQSGEKSDGAKRNHGRVGEENTAELGVVWTEPQKL